MRRSNATQARQALLLLSKGLFHPKQVLKKVRPRGKTSFLVHQGPQQADAGLGYSEAHSEAADARREQTGAVHADRGVSPPVLATKCHRIHQ